MKDLSDLNNDDYQKRDGEYPKPGIPVNINAVQHSAVFSFKNTSEFIAKKWVRSFCMQRKIKFDTLISWQDGDYHDDWVNVEVTIEKAA